MKIKFLLSAVFVAAISTGFSSTILVNSFTNFESQAFTPLSAPWGDGASTNNDQVIQSTNYITIAPVNGGNPTGNGSFTSVLSGTALSPGAPLDFTGYNYLIATARTNAGNVSSSFTVQLWDTTGTEAAVATFSAASFTSSFTTFTVALTQAGIGNIHQIQYFYLTGDGFSSDAVNASFQNLTASTTAVPEPATWAFLVLSFGFLFLKLSPVKRNLL